MIGALIGLIVTLLIVGILYWGLLEILKVLSPFLPGPIVQVIRVVAIVILVLIVIYALLSLIGVTQPFWHANVRW